MSERAAQLNPRSCDKIEDLLPLYPLGVLDQDETAAVISHVTICPACAAELLRFESVTDMLGEAVAPVRLPVNGRASLLADALTMPQDTMARSEPPAARPLAPITPIKKASANGWKAFALLAAAALILLAGGAAALTKSLVDDRNDARQSAQSLAPFIDANTTMVAMAAQPGAQTESCGKGVLIESNDGSMAVVVNGCLPSNDERVYKVWVGQGKDRVVLGDMKIDIDGKGWMPVSMPAEMPAPEILGVSVIEGSQPLNDLFIGQLSTT